ncbi:Rrf2 family transcriptional regulator [Rhizobium sp.]|jgi:Rrf2 family protein|uniref:RrF2 family transcriptional regulator n=1 Tax=Rhizobium sp. TaxID=391 RepID=UPI000E867825|nr:Rrf2 family transcriptional regulator [Rhizobium sp.]
MLSMKGKYGLKALYHLAGLPDGSVVQSAEIAQANGMSKKFLDAILADLRNNGFVFARKGRGGGYCLTRKPQDIMVGHVLRVLDGPLAPISCASRTAYHRCSDCADEKACAIRLTMVEVREAIASVLDTKSFADLHHMVDSEPLGLVHMLDVS